MNSVNNNEQVVTLEAGKKGVKGSGCPKGSRKSRSRRIGKAGHCTRKVKVGSKTKTLYSSKPRRAYKSPQTLSKMSFSAPKAEFVNYAEVKGKRGKMRLSKRKYHGKRVGSRPMSKKMSKKMSKRMSAKKSSPRRYNLRSRRMGGGDLLQNLNLVQGGEISPVVQQQVAPVEPLVPVPSQTAQSILNQFLGGAFDEAPAPIQAGAQSETGSVEAGRKRSHRKRSHHKKHKKSHKSRHHSRSRSHHKKH